MIPKNMKRKLGAHGQVRPQPTPKEGVEQFRRMKGRKRRRLDDWKPALDDEYQVPGQ